MKRLFILDAWILRKIEAASHFIQLWTGYTCFAQSRACYALAGLFILFLIPISGPLWFRLLVGFTYVIFSVVYVLVATNPLFRIQEDKIERGKYRNHRKHDPDQIYFRLIMTVFFWGLILLSESPRGLYFFIWLPMYLQACDPLPPGTERKHLRDLFRAPLVPAHQRTT